MRVRYTNAALADLRELLDYLERHEPGVAARVTSRIRDTIDRLCSFPHSAQATEDPDVRVALTTPYPYLVFYMVGPDEIIVRNVRHAARRRP